MTGDLIERAACDVERAIRTDNYAAAESTMHELGRAHAEQRLRADFLSTRLLSAIERANVPKWRACALRTYLLQHFHEGTACKAQRPREERDALPEIILAAGALHRDVTEAEDAALGAGYALFQRAGAVVRIAPSRDSAEMQVVEITPEHLHEIFDASAIFMRQDPKADGALKRARCPTELAKTYLARRGIGWNLPTLAGRITAPTLRADGSLLDMPGYDQRTGLYLDTADASYPDMPDAPTLAESADALDMLAGLLAEVSFKDDVSRSVALSAILTSLVRPSLGAAPMHAVTAPTPGTGKSYLVDLVALIATGRTATPIAAGSSDEELEKRLASALMAGVQFISLDNVTRAINGDLLNSMLTQDRVCPRILGKSQAVEVENTAFIMANGNNLAVPADMTRRVMLCSLDTNEERPELIEREHDPRAAVHADRGLYVAAGLTVLRGYIAAGRPDLPRALGSFEKWSDLIRGALVWLGQADPVDSMEAVRAVDPRRAEMLAMMEQWNAALGDARYTVADVIQASGNNGELRDTLMAIAGERGTVSAMRVGKWLSKNRGAVVGNRRFEPGLLRRGVGTWMLVGARPTETRDDNIAFI